MTAIPSPDVASTPPSPTGGGPWWLDAVLKLGVLPAVALYLIWWATSGVDARFDKMSTTIEVHASQQMAITAEEKSRDASLVALLRAICYGVNRTDEARAACEIGR